MKKLKRFSEKEIQFLKDNYPKQGAKYCAEELSRSAYGIRAKANRLKLKVLPETLFNNRISTYNIIDGIKMKICPNCSTQKILEDFGKDNNRYDGLSVYCKICVNKLSKNSRQKNIKAALKREAEYRASNKELIKKQQKEYKKNNPEKLKATKKKWKMNNKDKTRVIKRRRRAKAYGLNENYTKEQEIITKEAFSNCCARCSSTDKLHIDHHLSLSSGHPLTLQNAVLLCSRCNLSKGAKHPIDFYTTKELLFIKNILKLLK